MCTRLHASGGMCFPAASTSSTALVQSSEQTGVEQGGPERVGGSLVVCTYVVYACDLGKPLCIFTWRGGHTFCALAT